MRYNSIILNALRVDQSFIVTLLVSFKSQIPEKTNNLVVVWLVIDKDTKRVRIIVEAILLLRRWCWEFGNDDDQDRNIYQ